MMHRTTLASLALCALVAASGCDRRDTHPPDESRAADTTMQAADGGVVTRPADQGPVEQRCDGLEGTALQECRAQQAGTQPSGESPPIRP